MIQGSVETTSVDRLPRDLKDCALYEQWRKSAIASVTRAI